jgi:exonuclease VII large subunit
MKKLAQLLVLVMISGMIVSCSQTSQKSAEGDWTIDSLKITNIQEIYDNQISMIEEQEQSLQSRMDTTQNEQMKMRLQQQMQRIQQQKPASPADLEKNLSKRLMQIQSDSINVKMDGGSLVVDEKIPYTRDLNLEIQVNYKKGGEEKAAPKE